METLNYRTLTLSNLTISTDTEALAHLPPHQTVIDWYCAARHEGMTPAEAHESVWLQYREMLDQLPSFMKGKRE